MINKLILKLKQYIKKRKEIKNLSIGDIIWAKRYSTKKEKQQIKSGHQEGPFVIIKKDKQSFYAFCCTSSPHTNAKSKYTYLNVETIKYKSKYKSFINTIFPNKLKSKQYIYTMNHLNDHDLNNLYKYMYLNRYYYKKEEINIYEYKYTLNKGDIIKYKNDLYYINNVNPNTFVCYPLKKNNTKYNIILKNTKYYLKKEEIIINKNKYPLIDICNDVEIMKIYMLVHPNKKKEKIKQEPILCKTFYKGTVIVDINTLDKYLILDRIGNIIYTINLLTYLENNIDLNKYSERMKYQYFSRLSSLDVLSYSLKLKK